MQGDIDMVAKRRSTKTAAGEMVGSVEIAKRLGCTATSTPRTWKARYSDYPTEVAPGYWYWHEIKAWAEKAGLPEKRSA